MDNHQDYAKYLYQGKLDVWNKNVNPVTLEVAVNDDLKIQGVSIAFGDLTQQATSTAKINLAISRKATNRMIEGFML